MFKEWGNEENFPNDRRKIWQRSSSICPCWQKTNWNRSSLTMFDYQKEKHLKNSMLNCCHQTSFRAESTCLGVNIGGNDVSIISKRCLLSSSDWWSSMQCVAVAVAVGRGAEKWDGMFVLSWTKNISKTDVFLAQTNNWEAKARQSSTNISLWRRLTSASASCPSVLFCSVLLLLLLLLLMRVKTNNDQSVISLLEIEIASRVSQGWYCSGKSSSLVNNWSFSPSSSAPSPLQFDAIEKLNFIRTNVVKPLVFECEHVRGFADGSISSRWSIERKTSRGRRGRRRRPLIDFVCLRQNWPLDGLVDVH